MKSYITKGITVILVAIFVMCSASQAYPPDNAAVLHYESFLLMQDPNEAMTNQLSAVIKGEIDVNDSVIKFVEANRLALDYAYTATTIPMCDWGLDYSKGFDMPLPYPGKAKTMARLMLADAIITSNRGNHREALNKCLATYRFAHNIGNDSILVPFLLAVSIEGLTNSCIQTILPQIANDINSLSWLDAQLAQVRSGMPLFEVAVANDARVTGYMFNREQMLKVVSEMEKDKNPFAHEVRRRIESADEKFFVTNKIHWENYTQRILAAADLGYSDAFTKIKAMVGGIYSDANQNPDATLTALSVPGIHGVLTLDTRSRTQFNALRTAIAVYIIKAKTGKLPESLPANTPVDLFSGKPFEFQKTSDGFILRCQGKDLNKNETYEYAFKVGK